MTAQDLATFVGKNAVVDDYVTTCWNTAIVLVDAYIGTVVVPQVLKDRAYLMVGAELWHQKNAPQGVAQFTDWEGAPMRVARNPMIPAYALLSGFVVGF